MPLCALGAKRRQNSKLAEGRHRSEAICCAAEPRLDAGRVAMAIDTQLTPHSKSSSVRYFPCHVAL
jgi:hypothetical protein